MWRTVTRPQPEPEHPWIEELRWHQRTFNCAKWQWLPERPQKAVVRRLGGREIFRKPADYTFLEQSLLDCYYDDKPLSAAMGKRLQAAREALPVPVFRQGQELIGYDDTEVNYFTYCARTEPPELFKAPCQTEWKQVLRGLPIHNPLIEVWELRQQREFFTAFENLIEDAVCDLQAELLPRYGWDGLALLHPLRDAFIPITGADLERRFERQREARGEPGDPRRIAKTDYTRQKPGGSPLGQVGWWTWA